MCEISHWEQTPQDILTLTIYIISYGRLLVLGKKDHSIHSLLKVVHCTLLIN